MKKIFAIFTAFCIVVLIFGSCFSSWDGEPGEGTISINLGGGAPAQRSVTTDAETVYEITLTSADEGSNKTETWPLIGSSTTVITVSSGSWNISIAAYRNEQDKQDEKPFAEGKTVQPVTVIAGENSDAKITLDWKDGTINVVINDESKNTQPVEYTIILTSPGKEPQTKPSKGKTTTSFFVQPGLWKVAVGVGEEGKWESYGETPEDVEVKAGEKKEISIDMFPVGSWEDLKNNIEKDGKEQFSFDSNEILFVNESIQIPVNKHVIFLAAEGVNVTIKKASDGNFQNSMFRVPTGSSLTLGSEEGGGKITLDGNSEFYRGKDSSSLIYVGNFRQNPSSYGESGGTLIMYEGVTLTNNYVNVTTNDRGGAVVVDGGTFKMYGGEISGNTNTSSGGGVRVIRGYLASTNMTASRNGPEGIFIKTGGTIQGNTAKKGNAVFFGVNQDSDDPRNRPIAGPDDDFIDGEWVKKVNQPSLYFSVKLYTPSQLS